VSIQRLKRIISEIDMRSVVLFLTVGALTAVLYFSIFAYLWRVAHLHYRLAISIAYFTSILFHFTANRFVTFKSHGADFTKHVVKYLIMVMVNYLITLLVVHFVVVGLALSPYLGVISAIGATVGTGYLMAKFWVFRVDADKQNYREGV